ncbi:MAG: hypothetical protein JWM34_998 [Ilumatobacteraceae bacterium]|nr:hypothetical protein [Ilumatobacteraceae bacterium]
MLDNAVFNHRVVIDSAGHKVGTVSDVVPDPETLQARWLVVDTGITRTSHYMPVVGAEPTPTGEIQVPFDKSLVTHAIKATGAHVLSEADQQDLAEYYGVRN